MNVDSCFEILEDKIPEFIDRKIAAKLPEVDRAAAKERAISIVKMYEGRDTDAISILAYAAEHGRFHEFAEKLENYHGRDFAFIDPELRRWAELPGARKAERFFLQCYEDLGIKPRG